MTAVWLVPAAWWGLMALSLPLVIHLLARQRGRPVPFPSLRFLQTTQLAAFRRRVWSDVPLLIVRLLVVTAAVTAVTAPVFITPARRLAWEGRTARAIIHLAPGEGSVPGQQTTSRMLVEGERAGAFVTWSSLATGRASDAIATAVDWLNQQPPASRELVIVGDIRVGLLTEADIVRVPPPIGIRFVPGEAVPPRSFALSVTSAAAADAGAAFVRSVGVTLEDDATRVVRGEPIAGAANVLSILAAPADAPIVMAIVEAVLGEGLVLSPSPERRVIIELQGAPNRPITTPAPVAWMREVLEMVPGGGGERDGALVARVGLSPSDPRAVQEVARIARAALAEPLDRREPRRVSAATLAAWSRPPSGVPESAPIADEGDGRWLWLMVLALLAVEQVMRRRQAIGGPTEASAVEARVA